MIKHTIRHTIAALLAAGIAVLCSCDDGSGLLESTTAQIDRSGIEQTIDRISDGTIRSVRAKNAGQSAVYAVDWKTTNGAMIDIALDRNSHAFLEAEADHGPFNYEFDAGMGLIPLSQAREIAVTAGLGELSQWSLKQDDGDWIYTIEIDPDFNNHTGRDGHKGDADCESEGNRDDEDSDDDGDEDSDDDDGDEDSDDDDDEDSDDDGDEDSDDDDGDEDSDDDGDEDSDDDGDEDSDDDGDEDSDDDDGEDSDDDGDEDSDDDGDEDSDDDGDEDSDDDDGEDSDDDGDEDSDDDDDDSDDDDDDDEGNKGGVQTIRIDASNGMVLSVD